MAVTYISACYIFEMSFERWEEMRAYLFIGWNIWRFAAVLAPPEDFFSKKYQKYLGFILCVTGAIRYDHYDFLFILLRHTLRYCIHVGDRRVVWLIKCVVSVRNVTHFFFFFFEVHVSPPNSTLHHHHRDHHHRYYHHPTTNTNTTITKDGWGRHYHTMKWVASSTRERGEGSESKAKVKG